MLQHQELEYKDILTLQEAAFYLSTDPGTLLEEVVLGKLPGGRLGGQWHFCKSTLTEHFSIYHGAGPYDWNTEIADKFQDKNQRCDPETVERLLKEYARGDRNFAAFDLRGAVLSGTSLAEIDLAEGLLQKIDLCQSNLQGADFQNANLTEANLSGANLSQASFIGANLSGANLSKAILLRANLQGATMSGVNLFGANLQDTSF